MLIAIEGIDGAGKRTQAELLTERIRRNAITCEIVSFPRYSETVFSESIARYLNGGFGELQTVDPHLAALLYAGDRFESRALLARALSSNDVVILDRYVASNFAYQSARVAHEQQWEFIGWIARIEHEVYGMPRADLALYLDVPVIISEELIERKEARSYTTLKADIHEQDRRYLARCRETYEMLFQHQYGSEWAKIECVDGGRLLTPDAIHAKLWQPVSDVIAAQLGQPALR